ncbi:MAG: DHA2 family efflux MFS transporter permease subunit [Dehalococcoidia bacterium]
MNNTQPNTASVIYRRRWWTLAVLAMSVIIVTLDNSILNVALPTLQRDLDASVSELQWMVDAYIMVFASLILTMGAIGDRIGRANALRAGMIIFAGGSLFAMASDSPGTLITARAIMGFGPALIIPATLASIMHVFPPAERPKAVGVWAAMSGVGVALGPITGGLLLEHFSWGAIFFINIPIAIVAVVAGAFLIPNSRDPNPRRLDILGTFLSAGALAVLVYGLINGGDWGWTDGTVIGCLVGAGLLMMVFLWWERHTPNPILPISLFGNPRFSAGAAGNFLLMLTNFGLVFGLTLYMQFVRDYTALETGVRLLPLAIGFAIGSSTSHARAARFGTTAVVTVGFVAVAAILAGISFWGADTDYWVLGLMLFATSFSMGNILPSNLEALMGAVPQARAGVGSAMNGVAVQLGGSIGVAALGSILSGAYTSSIKPALVQFPDLSPQAVAAAGDSIGGAAKIADQLPEGLGETLKTAANHSFMDGWQLMALVACGIAAAGALIAIRFMPPKPLAPPQSVPIDGAPSLETALPSPQSPVKGHNP